MSWKESAAAPEIDWFDLDLERDMPTTPADTAALERARMLRPLPPGDYQRWIDLLEAHHPVVQRGNRDSDEPFEL
jgi:hypothetical protein